MKYSRLLLIAACVQPYTQAVVTIKAPIATTVPLQAKVYGINDTQAYRIQESEKPTLFKPFDAMINNYSWKYISKVRPNELGYVLLGYDDKDKAAARESGAALFDPARNQLSEPAPDVSAAVAEEVVPAATPLATTPALATSTPQASASALPALPTGAPTISVSPLQDSKQLLLEVNVMCTNIPGVPLRKKQINDAIKDGKVYGTSFDLKGHKQCYIVAKKYKDDAPAAEIQEFIEKIYGGVLGVGGSLE